MELRMIPIMILMLSVAACHPASDYDNPQRPSGVAVDTSFEPTGNAALDSLLQLAAVSSRDTNLVKLYNQIAEMYEDNDLEKSKEYYLKLGTLTELLNWSQGYYWFAVGFSTLIAREGLADSAIVVYQRAHQMAVKENDEEMIALIAINTATIYKLKEWYQTALDYYMEGLSYFEPQNDTRILEYIYYNLCELYSDIEVEEKAIEYGEKAYALNPENPYVLTILSKAYAAAHQYETAKSYSEKALEICRLQNNVYVMREVYFILGTLALYDFDLEKAETYAQHVIESDQIFGSGYLYYDKYLLSKIEQLKGNYSLSETYIRDALQIAEENDLQIEKKRCYMILSELTVAQHNYRDHIRFMVELDKIEKTMAKNATLRAAAEMEARYETAKKELKITTLEEEKRFMIWLSISGGAVLLLSLASCFFLWRWTVQKKRLAEQQIKQLIQEKQLVATQSVLDGETRERARLARDLHDGLGSLLTGVKLQLLEMKQGVKLEYADSESFDKALGMLDDSVSEMRRVAHHLMPDSLSRFGLKPAVADFCTNLPMVQFAYYGDESRLDPNMEVMLYRSIHELVNNALKHAGATRIMVQIIQEPDRIAFTVQDDGTGFNPSAVTEGMGLQNIRTRIEVYNGLLDINSTAGEGTEINGELKI